jgi:predicted GIY-YIG superfamily endonuclease
MNWQVYIILCSDGSLYTGITTGTFGVRIDIWIFG